MKILNCLYIIFAVTFSVYSDASPKYMRPIDQLSAQEKLNFWVGAGLFRSPWVAAPASTKGRDGLGPLFNARSCDACHRNGAGGDLPEDGLGLVVRISEYNPTLNSHVPSPVYGSQIQSLSVKSFIGGNSLPEESKLKTVWKTKTVNINNTLIQLPKPLTTLTEPRYGDIKKDSKLSPRIAPPVYGLGMIDKLSTFDILLNEDIDDKNKDGISGKANRVPDIPNKTISIGRFGHKSEQPSLLQQVASALNQDIGLTSWLFPEETCTQKQSLCLKFPNGIFEDEKFEIKKEKLNLMVEFSKNLAPPISNRKFEFLKNTTGYDVFEQIGCNACHKPTLGSPASNVVHAYSDLLLHDMGLGLADNKPVFDASGTEWRTTPLWGLHRKLKKPTPRLLHDGRASTVEEAILWHEGEAFLSRKKYWLLPQTKKHKLISFLEQL